jgi:hypothetical protein
VPSLITRIKPYSDRSSQSVKTEKNQFAKHTPNHAGLSRGDSTGRDCTLCYSTIWDVVCGMWCGALLLLSSIESVVQNRIASTALVWPILCARCIACISTAGFHQGSSKNTAKPRTYTHAHAYAQTDGQYSAAQSRHCGCGGSGCWHRSVLHSPCEAHCRLSPSPPARRLSSIISTLGFVLNACSIALR